MISDGERGMRLLECASKKEKKRQNAVLSSGLIGVTVDGIQTLGRSRPMVTKNMRL